MSKACKLKLGAAAPDFKLDTFDAEKGDFGEVSLEQLKADGKWAILFFYPADFTFV